MSVRTRLDAIEVRLKALDARQYGSRTNVERPPFDATVRRRLGFDVDAEGLCALRRATGGDGSRLEAVTVDDLVGAGLPRARAAALVRALGIRTTTTTCCCW